MVRYTLTEMRAANKRAGLYFFSRDIMRMFAPAKYKTRYDTETDTNYLLVEQQGGKKQVWYIFTPKTGAIDFLAASKVPARVRGR
jgi:hypothetical protein